MVIPIYIFPYTIQRLWYGSQSHLSVTTDKAAFTVPFERNLIDQSKSDHVKDSMLKSVLCKILENCFPSCVYMWRSSAMQRSGCTFAHDKLAVVWCLVDVSRRVRFTKNICPVLYPCTFYRMPGSLGNMIIARIKRITTIYYSPPSSSQYIIVTYCNISALLFIYFKLHKAISSLLEEYSRSFCHKAAIFVFLKYYN